MENVDILNELNNVDLSTVKGYPLLPSGVYDFEVKEMVLEDQKSGSGKNLVIKYALVDPTTDIEGAQVHPGYVVTERISLVKTFNEDGTERYNPLPRLKQFREAIFGKTSEGTAFMPLEQYFAQRITLRLKYEANVVNKKSKEEYGPQTSVAGYVKRAAS